MTWIVSTILRPFLPYIAGGLAILALTAGGYLLWLRADNAALDRDKQIAVHDLAAAVAANKSNLDTIRHLNRAAEIDRQTTAAAIANDAARRNATDKAVQEIQNDPRAFAPAGPVFDDLGDRLRAIDAPGGH